MADEYSDRVIRGARGLNGLSVDDMKELLRNINIATSGNRRELCMRIQSAIEDGLIIYNEEHNTFSKNLHLRTISTKPPVITSSNLRHEIIPIKDIKIPLIERFEQPFPIDINLDEFGNPLHAYERFVHKNNHEEGRNKYSSKYNSVVEYNRKITTFPDITSLFLSLLNIHNVPCIGNMFMYSVDEEDLKNLVPRYGYLDRLLTSIQDHVQPGIDFRFSANINRYYSNKYKPSIQSERYNRMVNTQAKSINDCIQNDRLIVRLHIGLVIFKSIHTDMIRFSPNQDVLAHSTQVLIDMETKTAFILESSFTQDNSLEMAKDESIELFLQEYIDPEIVVEHLDLNSCPAIKLQGDTGLCATWSLYLFLLYILNPTLTRNDIFNIFSEYTQEERNDLIYKFMFYEHSLNLGDALGL